MLDTNEDIKSVFTLGSLSEKQELMQFLRDSGRSMMFEGEIDWSILLIDTDQRLKGNAPSLDEAFDYMINTITLLLEDHDANTPVLCSINLDRI